VTTTINLFLDVTIMNQSELDALRQELASVLDSINLDEGELDQSLIETLDRLISAGVSLRNRLQNAIETVA